MERRRCAACEQAFRPRAQSPGQLYCGQASCQRERRRRWQENKRQHDEDYRANQARAQRVWAADHRDYWRAWRAAHPEYTERNRVAQRRRDDARQASRLARMDASPPISPVASGTYAGDWRQFDAWCSKRSVVPLGCGPGVVAAYLSDLAHTGRKASTIARAAASIGYHHKIAGHEPPTSSEGVKAVMRGIRRTIGTARTQKSPATADIVGAMLEACTDTLAGIRDRALIAVGFATAMRRSELCALELADLVPVEDGFRILIRRSKGDQEGLGQEVALPRAIFSKSTLEARSYER